MEGWRKLGTKMDCRNGVLIYKENVYGEYVYSAIRLKNMVQEMMLKVSLYNKMKSI
jgi:hypothetical protein